MVWEGSGGSPKGLGGVGRTTLRSGRVQEAHMEVREGLEGPPKVPRGIGRPT